jgi:hypothetical protein
MHNEHLYMFQLRQISLLKSQASVTVVMFGIIDIRKFLIKNLCICL